MKIMKKDESKISIDFSIRIYGVLEFIYFLFMQLFIIISLLFMSFCNYLSVCMHSLRSDVVFDQYPDVIFMLAFPFQSCNMILIVHVLARTPKLVKRGVRV